MDDGLTPEHFVPAKSVRIDVEYPDGTVVHMRGDDILLAGRMSNPHLHDIALEVMPSAIRDALDTPEFAIRVKPQAKLSPEPFLRVWTGQWKTP